MHFCIAHLRNAYAWHSLEHTAALSQYKNNFWECSPTLVYFEWGSLISQSSAVAGSLEWWACPFCHWLANFIPVKWSELIGLPIGFHINPGSPGGCL